MNKYGNIARVLLSSKLNPPSATPSQVTRSKIRDLVGMSQSVKLILVRAPAGFGKTTAMAQCRAQFEENDIDSVWLTLDSNDNDASRFLACLAAAVTQMTGEPAVHAKANETAPGFSVGDIAIDIMERLAAHASPFALFLDDFEHVQDSTVLELVRELLDHLPRRGQLIIGSRGLPNLGLGRLRARGQLLEIDASQLRFSITETAEYLTQRRHIALPEEALSQLHNKTEGWVAALWLASLALERREGRVEFIARFSGSHEAVADYLADDVLARQPAELRDFLLRTSILRHLNAPLCDALLRRKDSMQILSHLETANLFLLPIEGEEKTYRYHSLFASFLRTELTRKMADELPGLHHNASNWYTMQKRPVPAIDHALDGQDYEQALNLLSQHAETLLEEGRMRLLTRWFATIPKNYLRNTPLLQVVQVWALCFTHGPWDAMNLLESTDCTHTEDPSVRAYVLALRPAMFAMMDRNEEGYRVGAEALLHLPFNKPFADSALANQMAYISFFMGRRQETHKMLDAARRGQNEINGLFNRMYSETIEGIIDMEEGRLRQASARFRMAVSSTHAASYMHTHGNAFAGVMYADALYEVNELEQAAHLLHIYVPLAKDVGLPDHMIIGYLRLARIAFYRGDVDMVFEYLSELEYLGHQRQLPRVITSAKLERARILLMQGNRHASEDELQRANDPAIWAQVRDLRMPAHDLEYYDLGQMRWDIHFGDAAQAAQKIATEIDAAVATKRYRRKIKLQVLQSLALKHSGAQRAALALLHDALVLTCKEGFQRIILDEGNGVGGLLHQLIKSMREQNIDHNDPIFSEYLQRLLQEYGALPDDEPKVIQQNELVDPLTPKEIRILLLLAEGYSNGALAEKLFVSDSTVRTHLRNISSKLNAQNRTQAVAIARSMGIIH